MAQVLVIPYTGATVNAPALLIPSVPLLQGTIEKVRVVFPDGTTDGDAVFAFYVDDVDQSLSLTVPDGDDEIDDTGLSIATTEDSKGSLRIIAPMPTALPTSAIHLYIYYVEENVLLTGAQTVAGVKTFSSDPIIPDEAYGVGWNGSLEPPTKNAVYDKIETISGGSVPFTAASSSGAATLEFAEDTDNGTNKVTLQGPASTADVTVTLPAAAGTIVLKDSTDTLTNKTIDANGTGNSISNLEVADFAASAIVTAADTISGNDNDTTIPTSAAVKDYADSVAGGSVATDAIWDAAGDLAVGSGANTAARLAIGTALQVLRVNSGATGLEWAAPSGGSSDFDDIITHNDEVVVHLGNVVALP